MQPFVSSWSTFDQESGSIRIAHGLIHGVRRMIMLTGNWVLGGFAPGGQGGLDVFYYGYDDEISGVAGFRKI
jgi:hypothetical protein